MDSRPDPTELPLQASNVERAALNAVFPLVYDELRRIARRHLRREAAGHTLSTTALVHEAYLRLIDHGRIGLADRAQFLAVAAVAMRRILIDHARKHRTGKRGGGLLRVPLEEVHLAAEDRAELLLALDAALERLASHDARQARVVECRFFGGMTEQETADALGIGLRTVKRDWAKARSWLYQALYPEDVG